MQKFLDMIAEERKRQVEKERYSPKHDDEHTDGSIADAAACYAANTNIFKVDASKNIFPMRALWPWGWSFFKKENKTREQQLITAGALIVAELERLDRAKG